MLRIACLPILVLLAVGCASRQAPPVATPTATGGQTSHATPRRAQADSETVELRHFYLLSPGPSSTLVVTRSEPAPPPH